jgi:hypothetical protein
MCVFQKPETPTGETSTLHAQPQSHPLLLVAPVQAAPNEVAQVASDTSGRTTNLAARKVYDLQSTRATKLRAKKKLAASYDKQIAELDALKRQRASWRRDRQIRSKKAKSQTVARKLSAFDSELRSLNKQVRSAQKALLKSIDAELKLGVSSSRREMLSKMRKPVTRALRKRARKIVLPDDEIDELADPEDLEEQAALLLQAEKQLLKEQRSLEQRGERYERMAELRSKRNRAEELTQFDDNQVRRSTGRLNDPNKDSRGSNESSDGAQSADPSDDNGGQAPPEPGTDADLGGAAGDFSTASVVLADVIGATAVDALRRAGQSSDPRVKAKAAKRARDQVKSRLERLRARRKAIQALRNRKLRRQR